jgi:hypothetical protein
MLAYGALVLMRDSSQAFFHIREMDDDVWAEVEWVDAAMVWWCRFVAPSFIRRLSTDVSFVESL